MTDVAEAVVHDMPEAADFWRRVEITSRGCWEWTGSRTSNGYGNLRLPGNRFDYAHRVAYRLKVGPIPDGLHIDHLCRVRHCVNPEHLEPVTQAENIRRGLAPYGGLRETCRHGHDITDLANVYVAPRGDRRCRVCASIQNDRRREKRQARRRAEDGR